MIKDVWCAWTNPADDLRLAAAKNIANTFDGQVIGLFLNPLPLPKASRHRLDRATPRADTATL
jgi:hypothetical protein